MAETKVDVRGFLVRHAGLEHPLPAYVIEIERGDGVWREETGSPESARVFLRGVQAGWSMAGAGHLAVPGVPPLEHLREPEED